MLHMRQFGDTGLSVSALGFGAANAGDPRLEDSQVEKLLNGVLDCGINLIDTARSYGLSEERVGRFLAHRRDEFLLSTKVGYGVDGYEDWTYDCVLNGVERALRTLKTDRLDIVHLHTCGEALLRQGDVISALEKAREQGKIRVVAYAGDNSEVQYALKSGRFGSVMTSINLFDQRFLDHGLWDAKERKLGIIAKRPLGNAPWRFSERPSGHYCEEYWGRMKSMGLAPENDNWTELALRFAVFTYGVDCAVVGTTNLDHLKENLKCLDRGKLPQSTVDMLRNCFREHDFGWSQQI